MAQVDINSSQSPPPNEDGNQTSLSETGTEPISNWDIIKSVLREALETIILTLVIFFLIQLMVRNFRVEGSSMQPNLQNGQFLVVDKLSYHFWRDPTRGDVIVFNPPVQRSPEGYVKRIIGLPGETIELKQGNIYINGNLFEDPYGVQMDISTMPPKEIPPDHIFVLGDNRPNSNDSRSWGMLEQDEIIGLARFSYWPPQTWGAIPNNGPTKLGQSQN